MLTRLFIVIAVIAAVVFFYTTSNSGVDTRVQSISSDELSLMLKDKDFILIDVHIPEQEHIPGTDYVIPFNQVDDIVERIPDKKVKVVIYCRSGSMSKSASEELVKRGYVNVYDLSGGMNAWKSKGFKTIPIGSVN